MPRQKSKDQVYAWLMALEAERHDNSWRKREPVDKCAPAVQTVIRTVKQQVKLKQDKRDQIMYHAGRYAMGARDNQAIEADNELQQLWEN